jgi:SOS-response transcriptional repressor LexA
VSSKTDDVLEFLKKYQEEKGFWPAYKEIQAELGCSLSQVHRHMNELVERGDIVRQPGSHRAISIPEFVRP